MVAYWSRNVERQASFASQLPASEVPSMLIGVEHYPTQLVRIGVRNGVNEGATVNTSANESVDPVDHFEIAEVKLRHLGTDSVRTIAILTPSSKEA